MIDPKSSKKLFTEHSWTEIRKLYAQLSVFHDKSHAFIKLTPTDIVACLTRQLTQTSEQCSEKWIVVQSGNTLYTTNTF